MDTPPHLGLRPSLTTREMALPTKENVNMKHNNNNKKKKEYFDYSLLELE